jgi:tight adherence protein C
MDVSDVSSFIAAIIQADQLGVSIAKVLRIQSEQMRIRRRQRAEEKAHQAPIKMLFPMVFLIFPAIWVVLLGPAILVIMHSGVMGVI